MGVRKLLMDFIGSSRFWQSFWDKRSFSRGVGGGEGIRG